MSPSLGRYCLCGGIAVLNESSWIGTFLLDFRLDKRLDKCPTGAARHARGVADNHTEMNYLESGRAHYQDQRRARLGGTPVSRRKCRARWLWSEKPAARAICDRGSCVSRSICSTCCTLRRSKY